MAYCYAELAIPSWPSPVLNASPPRAGQAELAYTVAEKKLQRKGVLLWFLEVLVELSEAGELHHKHNVVRLTHADHSYNVVTV